MSNRPIYVVDTNILVDLLINNPMVAQMHFNENEVVRHPLVKMIAERQKV